MPMEAIIALKETSPLVSGGVPDDEVKQIASWDVSRQAAAHLCAAPSETNLTKIEKEFLEILQEPAESNQIDEGAPESEWHLFLKNLSPQTPTECNDMEKTGPQQEGDRNYGDASFHEWDVLLDRLSQLETPVVQQILGHIESDVLEGMVRFMHLRMIRDNPGEAPCQESITLNPNKEVSLLSDAPNEPVQEELEVTMQCSPELSSDSESVTNEFPEKQHGAMDLGLPLNPTIRWPHGSESQPTTTCDFRKDSGEQATWDPLGYSSHQVESKMEGTIKVLQHQLMMPQCLPRTLSPILERSESGIFEQLEHHLDLEPEPEPDSQAAALQGFKQVESRNLLPKSSPLGESDQEKTDNQYTEPLSDKLQGGQLLTNSNSCWTCSQQIESKLAEIPIQIASTLFMRTPLIMDSNLLRQLFRQIDQVLFQVMPKQILFSSAHPKQTMAHELWHHVPLDCSLRRQFDDGHTEYPELNQLEVLIPHRRHQFESTEFRENPEPTQVNEFTSGFGRTESDPMPHWQGKQSLNCQDVDSSSPCLWSAVFEQSTAGHAHLQLVPDVILDSGVTNESLRCPKLDAMSFISSHMGTGIWKPQMMVTRPPWNPQMMVTRLPWNPQMTVTQPPSSTYPFLLDKLNPPETRDDLSLPQVDSDQNTSQLLPIADDLIPEIYQCMDSRLPQENMQETKHMPSQINTDSGHLLPPQACVQTPFQQIDLIELHALRQNMCLTVLQQIAKQVEHNISLGLPLEINAGLLEALDLQPEDYWLQQSGQVLQPNQEFIHHDPDEPWNFQDADVIDSEAWPEIRTDFRELHEGMRRTVESSTSGGTTESSETDSPLYMADPSSKFYHRHYSYKNGHVDSLRQPIPHGKFFDEFEEFHGHAPESGIMPLYSPPVDMFDDVRQYMDMVTTDDELKDGFERSPDYMSSLNLHWVPDQELQQQQEAQATRQEADDEIENSIDFYLEGLAGTASDLKWFLDPNESLKSAAALEEQEDVVANDLPYDLGVSGDLPMDEDQPGSSAEHLLASNEVDELFLEGSDSGSRCSRARESETSTTAWDEAEELEDMSCVYCQPQLLHEAAGSQDSHEALALRLAQGRKSAECNPQSASVFSITESGDSDFNSTPNSDQHEGGKASSTSNPAEGPGNVDHALGSEVSEGPQIYARSSERQPSPELGNGTPPKIHTSSSTEECVKDQGDAKSESPTMSSSVVLLTNERVPTRSQFRDPSIAVRHTIFGLLVVAGGLYLVENRDEIEQQSISAAEAAAEAWRWLGTFLIRMAKGEFEN